LQTPAGLLKFIFGNWNMGLKMDYEFCLSFFFSFSGSFCRGDLIFEDNFHNFDLETWQHEITLAGGGVSEISL
jgi:hypothetical protein